MKKTGKYWTVKLKKTPNPIKWSRQRKIKSVKMQWLRYFSNTTIVWALQDSDLLGSSSTSCTELHWLSATPTSLNLSPGYVSWPWFSWLWPWQTHSHSHTKMFQPTELLHFPTWPICVLQLSMCVKRCWSHSTPKGITPWESFFCTNSVWQRLHCWFICQLWLLL